MTKRHGVIIAAPSSGAGKTTITLALLRALTRHGYDVRAAKSGPDYIDPGFHQAACGVPCANLDAWAMAPDRLIALANRAPLPDDVAAQAFQATRSPSPGDTPSPHGQAPSRPPPIISKLLVIEGAMGLFDGAPPDGRGSVADLARILALPVILVVDAGRMAHSIAPLVAGFARHDPNVRIAGVILNNVGSERHDRMLRSALASIDMPVLASMARRPDLTLPSRHLGLIQAKERTDLDQFLDVAADALLKGLADAAPDMTGIPAPVETMDATDAGNVTMPAVPSKNTVPSKAAVPSKNTVPSKAAVQITGHAEDHTTGTGGVAGPVTPDPTDIVTDAGAETSASQSNSAARLDIVRLNKVGPDGSGPVNLGPDSLMPDNLASNWAKQDRAKQDRAERDKSGLAKLVALAVPLPNAAPAPTPPPAPDPISQLAPQSPPQKANAGSKVKRPATTETGPRGAMPAPLAVPMAAPRTQPNHSDRKLRPPAQRIALAQDRAFAFAYPHMLTDWRLAGAEILPFSPLADDPVPEADFAFLPGGYPELFAGQIASAETFLTSLRRHARSKPVYGECGGYMVMGETLVDAEGVAHAMAGLLPLGTSFATRQRHLGYRQVQTRTGPTHSGLPPALCGAFNAHEFHYATTLYAKGTPLFRAQDAEGTPLPDMGLITAHCAGSFAHIIDAVPIG